MRRPVRPPLAPEIEVESFLSATWLPLCDRKIPVGEAQTGALLAVSRRARSPTSDTLLQDAGNAKSGVPTRIVRATRLRSQAE